MTIWIDNRTDNDVFEDYENVLKKIVVLCLKEEEYPENIELSISIVDNLEIQKLNKQFRNIDKPTDVLSFPMLEFECGLDDINVEDSINIDTNEIVLGDIIISIEKAIEQSKEFEHSIQRELAFLTAHSMFHIMGYDHKTVEDEEVMKQKQENVLLKAELTR